MALEFVIIPYNQDYERDAHALADDLEYKIYKQIYIDFDTNYDSSLSSRIAKYMKEDKDIIIINESYIEINKIIIRFSEKGSRNRTMSVYEFIDLINSFDYNEKEEKEEEKEVGKDIEKNEEKEDIEDNQYNNGKSFCVIM